MSTKHLTPAIVCGFPSVSECGNRARLEIMLSNGTRIELDDPLDEDCNSLLLDLKRGQRVNLYTITGKYKVDRNSLVLFSNRAAAISIDCLFQVKSILASLKVQDVSTALILDLLSEKIDHSLFDIERAEGQTQGSYDRSIVEESISKEKLKAREFFARVGGKDNGK